MAQVTSDNKHGSSFPEKAALFHAGNVGIDSAPILFGCAALNDHLHK